MMFGKPERLPDYDRPQQVNEVAFRRLMGEFQPSETLTCDAGSFASGKFEECGKPAICWVGGGLDHPSCEQHARGESYACALGADDA